MKRLYAWNGVKHPEADEVIKRFQRTCQVWEDVDDWMYFVVGEATPYAWDEAGLPTHFNHRCLVLDHHGDVVEWPLEESVDRPLEAKAMFTRLA